MCLLFLVLPHDCVKTSRKTPLSPHLQPNCFELEHYSSFLRCFAFVFANGFNTFEQFVQKAQRSCIFFPCLLPIRQPNNSKKEDKKKQLIRRTLEATKTRDQNLFWFSGNLLHATPCQAKAQHYIVLSSFRTRWIIRRLLLGQIRRRFFVILYVTRQIFFFSNKNEDENQNRNKKVSGESHSLARSLSFIFQICGWIFRCPIATILSEHFPISKIELAWILKQKHKSKQENPCRFHNFIRANQMQWSLKH